MDSEERGFTLIEALIAFVVLTVGILGALLFHGQLLSSSAENKTKLEAVQIAESIIEQTRADLATATAVNFPTKVLALSYPPVNGKLNTYTISLGTPTIVVSGAPATYELPISVTWPVDGSTKTLTLSTYFGHIDLTSITPTGEVGGGSGSDTYAGDIPLPTGTMRAVERVQLVAGTIAAEDIEKQQGNVVLYDSGDEKGTLEVAIKIDGTNYVKLGEFDSADNEIFTITGRIYNNHRYPFYYVNGANNFNTYFGEVYGLLTEPTAPYETAEIDGTTYYYLKNIIDIEATEGANCIIGRFENAGGWSSRANEGDNAGFDVDTRVGGASKQDRPTDVPWYADYICVAGTGWNGTINPYIRSYSDNDNEIDINLAGGKVCSPENRSYRYYLLDTEDLDGLLAKRDILDWSNGDTLQSIFTATSTSVKGQSGLVRFTSAADGSGERVPWTSYLWHNPNYIVSPSQSDSTLPITPSVAGPSGYVARYAESGYFGPQAVSTGLGSYEVMLPGDLSHQNFYISDDARDCTSWTVGTSGTGISISDIVSQADSAFADGFLKPSYLVSPEFGNQKYPGGTEAGYGYIPPNSNGWFDEADYNTEIGSGNGQGVIVLGYSIVTERIEGKVFFDNTAASAAVNSFTIGGVDENPSISIVCSALPDTLAVDTVNTEISSFQFYCSVPNNWDGEIYAYANQTPQVACGKDSLDDSGYFDYSNASEVVSGATWGAVSSSGPSITEFYTGYLGGDVSDGSASVSSSQFGPLGYYDLTVDRLALAEDSKDESFDFYFGVTASSDSCL